jgi:EAL domain-containing protein (putative c-di-GMP-specific phosphodiesterase class I)
VALAPVHGEDSVTLLQRADVAMYGAKSDGVEIAFYSPDKDHYSPRRLAIVGELRRAIDAQELNLVFQPKVGLVSGEVLGAEVLARWKHPQHGYIPPDEFIPVAEQSGLIRSLTSLVIRGAVEHMARWRDEGRDLSLAVNLSARNLLDPNLVGEIDEILRAAAVPPDHLILELTESAVMSDPVRSVGVLARLGELGVRLSVDDFGTGYSSLSRLTRLPVTEVKIDKSFVLNMLNDNGDDTIVRAIVELAHGLGLQVVAEGVEDDATRHRLTTLGCDAAQGYFFAKPCAPDAFVEWLDRQTALHLPSGPGDPYPAAGGDPAGLRPGARQLRPSVARRRAG